MKKKIYISPLFEVLPMETLAAIMITSVETTIGSKPSEPGGAPRRRTEVF